MNYLIKIFSAFFLLILNGNYLFSQNKFHAQVPDLPITPALVNDFAKMLTSTEVDMLETKLFAYEQESSNEIAIVTVNNLGGMDIAQFSVELGRKWNIGKRDKLNGVLILAAKEERQIFIAPGAGLQGVLPDMICNQIVREQIVPNFKQGNFYDGFNEASDKIIAYTRGEFFADDNELKTIEKKPIHIIPLFLQAFLIMAIIFCIILFVLLIIKTKGKTYMSGKGYRNDDDDFWGGGFGGGSSYNGGFGSSSSSSSSGGFGGFGGFGGGGGGFNGGGSGGSW